MLDQIRFTNTFRVDVIFEKNIHILRFRTNYIIMVENVLTHSTYHKIIRRRVDASKIIMHGTQIFLYNQLEVCSGWFHNFIPIHTE